MKYSRQFLPLFAVVLLVASAFIFVPVSAESSLNIEAVGDHNEYSFASVNGTATFVVTSNLQIPFKETYLPLAKLMLEKHLSHQESQNNYIN